MAGLIAPSTLEQIRNASDIVDVIGAYIPLKRAGANFLALCPFHREKTPSFNVHPHRQIFHCFGCHKGGDVFTFVQEYESISFMEAVRRLAERAHIPLELEDSPGAEQGRNLKEALRQIHEQITIRWQAALQNETGQAARAYLQKRSVSPEAIQLFRIGYAPEAWDDTVNWAKSKGYELELVEKAGLILRKEGTDRYYDRFRGRLIFPICDEQERVIGFSGRLLAEDAKAAKYVNSPETALFTKGRVFFGLDKSKRALLDADCAIICEGQLDLISCFMAGVQNVVAPQGTALTADHARILKRYVAEVVLCFDSDLAGQAAAIRSLDSLLAVELAIRVAVVPAPHDPDSYIRQAGGPAFRKLIDLAQGFFDFYLDRLCSLNDRSADRGRLTIVREMAEAVRKTGNVVLLDTYAQKTALRLGVAPEAVRAEFLKTAKPRAMPAPTPDSVSQPAPRPARPSQMEFWLLKLLLREEELAAWALSRVDLAWIQNEAVRHVLSARFEAQRAGLWHGVAALISQCNGEVERTLVTEAMAENRSVEDAQRSVEEIVLRLRNQHLDRELAALRHRVGQPGVSEAEQAEILTAQTRLRRQKQDPLA